MATINDTSEELAAVCMELAKLPRPLFEIKYSIVKALLAERIATLVKWSWWRDGVQYVGASETPIGDAMRDAYDDALIQYPESKRDAKDV